MAPSNAPRTGHGGFSSNGRHARRSHDAGEDALFALSLDDVMSELDAARREAVVRFAQTGIQTVVTTTNLGYFSPELLDASEVVRF